MNWDEHSLHCSSNIEEKLRLIHIGGFNVIRAMDVLFDWTDGMLTSHLKSGTCLVVGKFLRNNLELVFVRM